jgi:hypothetical protein
VRVTDVVAVYRFLSADLTHSCHTGTVLSSIKEGSNDKQNNIGKRSHFRNSKRGEREDKEKDEHRDTENKEVHREEL